MGEAKRRKLIQEHGGQAWGLVKFKNPGRREMRRRVEASWQFVVLVQGRDEHVRVAANMGKSDHQNRADRRPLRRRR